MVKKREGKRRKLHITVTWIILRSLLCFVFKRKQRSYKNQDPELDSSYKKNRFIEESNWIGKK